MKSYLVTGGLGYVGSWIVRQLGQSGHHVFVLSRGDEAPDLGVPYTLIQSDIAKQTPEALAALLPANLDGCIHAASFNETFTPGYPEKALHINAWGTRIMLDALHMYTQHHLLPQVPLFLYCSTFHVYGINAGIINEETPLSPGSDYALTHLFAEEYCRMAHKDHGQPYIITRLTNGYGAPLLASCTKWYLVLNDLCRSAYTEGTIRLRSNPNTLRDFVWLGDVAKTMDLLINRPDLSGEVFCIASTQPFSLKELADRVLIIAQKVLHKQVKLICEQAPTPVLPLTVDASKLRQAIGIEFTDQLDQEITAIFHLLQKSS